MQAVEDGGVPPELGVQWAPVRQAQQALGLLHLRPQAESQLQHLVPGGPAGAVEDLVAVGAVNGRGADHPLRHQPPGLTQLPQVLCQRRNLHGTLVLPEKSRKIMGPKELALERPGGYLVPFPCHRVFPPFVCFCLLAALKPI